VSDDMKPEQYWVQRGENLIARCTVKELLEGRQASTYRALWAAVAARRVKQVCDLGCNTGAVGKVLFHEGFTGEYTGVENNPYALKVGIEDPEWCNARPIFRHGNVRKLDIKNREYECVTMKDVLEHLEDFKPALGEAFRIADRYVIIAQFIPWENFPPIIKKEPEGYYHNRYNRRAVYDFAKSCGWVIEETIQTKEGDRNNEVAVFTRRLTPHGN
jgi:ubiquinone/menaquinone biosynthesis C-methylase UbiE